MPPAPRSAPGRAWSTGVKPSRHQHLDRVALQGQFQQHGLVLEEVEAVPGHAGAPPRNPPDRAFRPVATWSSGGKSNLGSGVLPRKSSRFDLSSTPIGASGCERLGICRWSVVQLGGHGVEFRLRRWVFSRSCRPSSLRASRSAGSLALPIDLETSFAWRLSSSTSICSGLACRFELDEAVHVNLHAAVGAVC